jgi:probable rRNA maturation factor
MRRLNLRYRGVDAATDVLSFPQFASEGRPLRASRLFKGPSGKKSTYEILSGGAMAPLALGDIVICPAKALEFAAEGGLAQAGAIRALLVHGFLHLMGYEHSPGGARARRMRAKEHELMKALG